MGKSDEYIEYEAYTRYLVKVTSTPYEPDQVEDSVFRDAVDKSELRIVYDIIARIVIVVTVVVIVCAGILIFHFI